MSNVRQLFRGIPPDRLASITPMRKAFAVTITFDGNSHQLNVLAFTTCDAICQAIDIYFDGDDQMPTGGVEIEAHPMNLLPSAA